MSDFGFGQKIDLFANPDLDFVLDLLENYAWRMGIYKEFPFLRHLHLEKIYQVFSSGNDAKKWEKWGETYMSRVLRCCKDVGTGTFSTFINFKRTTTGNCFSQEELSSEAFFLMLAGSDTSAVVVSGLLFYLAQYTDVYAKVANEIRATFQQSSQIQLDGLHCDYLKACITETLRLSPATVAAPWRDIHGKYALIDGELLPEGYEVGT
ncbi:hypothetical protein MMC11_008671 [Xylographa trunciseda]|nr:hypothetical protein [Xylographa trunciseda]